MVNKYFKNFKIRKFVFAWFWKHYHFHISFLFKGKVSLVFLYKILDELDKSCHSLYYDNDYYNDKENLKEEKL